MFFDPAAFPWTRQLEARCAVIRDEFDALDRRRLVLWPERGIYNHGWEVFGLYAVGRRLEQNCASCPGLAATLEAIPGLTTAGFSVLAPGTVIKPHRGYTSTVLRCHLGLVVPGACGLRVGDEVRMWEEGRCLVFDDTFEHEAWNLSEHPRVVLLLDVVRPGATFEPDFPGRQALLDYFRPTWGA
jgi:aspartyl/asparaginyl beta-hydroxylase (cupin superfamily)